MARAAEFEGFCELAEQELLTLAVPPEERRFAAVATSPGLRQTYPGAAKMFAAMAEKENGCRHRPLGLYCRKFGERITAIRRRDIKGFSSGKSNGYSFIPPPIPALKFAIR